MNYHVLRSFPNQWKLRFLISHYNKNAVMNTFLYLYAEVSLRTTLRSRTAESENMHLQLY